ncbi:MAG: hypothetical protein M0R76_11795 [Proteobacteria bacterium]|nr:hypothetical protein [Pseudomonadota bacterium]
MVAGTLVLGGLAIVPALGVAAIAQHMSANKKIKTLKEEARKLSADSEILRTELRFLDSFEKQCNILIHRLNRELATVRVLYREAHRRIYPLGFLSVFFEKVKRLFGMAASFDNKKTKEMRPVMVAVASLWETVEIPLIQRDDR